MSSNELVEQIMAQVIARVATPEQQAIPTENHPIRETAMAEKSCSLTEFVGTAGRFIHKHQLRLRHQIAGDLQTLLHAAGKGGGQVVNARRRDLHLL